MVVLALLVASCSSGDDSDSKGSTSTTGSQGSSTNTAAFQPTAPQQAVLDYLKSQGHPYVGDCADASLPKDKGSWCSTVTNDGDDQKTYEVGPVGQDPELILTVNRDGHATLTPGLQVGVDNGAVGTPKQLTVEQLQADPFINENVLLDIAAGLGNAFASVPGFGAATNTGAGAGGAGGGGGGGGAGGAGGNQVVGSVTVLPDENAQQGAAEYPPPAPNITVDNPTVQVGGEVVFRGQSCVPGETLTVFLDSTQVGAITADGQGSFVGSLTVPVGTKPGVHTITVRGAQCELSVQFTVLGDLAFTGAPNDTRTTVLVGLTVLVSGLVLVVGSRRRRRSGVASRRPG